MQSLNYSSSCSGIHPLLTSHVTVKRESACDDFAGAEEILGLGELNELEQKGLDVAIAELTASVEKGVKFAKDGSL